MVVLYVDADFAGHETRKSTSGWCLVLEYRKGDAVQGTALIAWGSIRQKVISLSTCEAELRACVDGSRELFGYLAQIEFLLGPDFTVRSEVRCDSTACISTISAGRSQKLRYLRKSVSVNLAWLQEAILAFLVKVDSALNRADIFTKCVEDELYGPHVEALGVRCATRYGMEAVFLPT